MTAFKRLLRAISKDHVYIQTHNYPDPDALASAKGLQTLLAMYKVRSTICYQGRIDKFSTLKMIELLHIEIFSGDNFNFTEEDEIILVDCQKGNQNVNDFFGNEIACIDHHPVLFQDNSYRFSHVNSNAGACSTIIAHFFMENRLPIDTETATALLYGLKMDTANLTRGVSDLDVDMFGYLYKLADKEILFELDSNSINLDDLKAYAKAIEDLRIYGSIGIANIGNNCSEAIIGTLSDFILSLNEVRFAVVYSYRAGGLKFSVRSDLTLFDSAKIIKKTLMGYGDGGGHHTMAAGFIPDIKTQEQAQEIAHLIEKRIIHEISLLQPQT